MKEKDKIISQIKEVVVDMTEECFDVCFESDGGGNHFVIYAVENKFNVESLRKKIYDLNIKRRIIIVSCNEEKIKLRHQHSYRD